MRVLIFAMDRHDAEKDIDAFVRTFTAAGHRCIRANYWTTDYLPRKPFLSSDVPMVTLVEGGLQNAPRLTAEDYLEAGGAIPDFADLVLHDAGAHEWPLTESMLSLESAYYQRMRGIAVKARSLIRSIGPDLVVVPQGAEPVGRAIAIEAGFLEIPILISESSFFPGFINMDVGAQHFFRGLSRIDRQLPHKIKSPLTSAEAANIASFVADWSLRHISKYEQKSAPTELKRLKAFTASGPGRVVFLPGQMPGDANILPGLGSHSTLHELYTAAIREISEDWLVVVKAHPKDRSRSSKALDGFQNVLVLEDLSIHDVIPQCDVVLVHSSNVGLEALMLGKPVVVLGTPLYSGLGLTTDIERIIELRESMHSAIAAPPGKEQVYRLLHYLLTDYLIPIGDADRIAARIAEAVEAGPAIRNCLKILAPLYSDRARKYLDTIRAYNVLARQNHSDAEIRQQLPGAEDPPHGKGRASLDSGERQIAYEYANVESGHLTRYSMANAVLRTNLRILDVACGVGYGSHLLADKAQSVIGVDGSPEAIDFAKSFWARDRVSFHVASAGLWFAQDQAQYDAVVSFETVEHMYDPQSFLSSVWSRLVPGGVLLLSSPNAEFYPLTDNPFHVRHFSDEDLARLLQVLPQMEDFRIWPQQENVIGPNARSGRFIVSAAVKAGGESVLRLALDELVPFQMTEVPIRRSFRIGAESFSTNIASKGSKEITSTFATTDGCIVFGPYHRLLAGPYLVHFDLSVSQQSKPGPGELILEVTNTHDELMAKAKLSSGQLLHPNPNGYSLCFNNRKQDAPIEFRIHARGKPILGSLHFRGVNIERIE